ncbi:MAG: lipopolysaccharide heptosyltransferase I [Planctomycetes bacterium]|nr:lipopolysaccharide heptosyltransferase I [Planctomycetota bacterium]
MTPDMDFSRTLIIKPSSLGDVVQALPVLTALRESHPQAHLAWLVSTAFADILRGHPRLDDVRVFDRRRFGRIGRSLGITTEFMAFIENLRRERFTTVLDLQGLFRSGFLAAATGAKSRVGFASARELATLFYTDAVPLPHEDMHAVDRYLALARHVGLADPKATDHLPAPAETRAAVRRRLQDEGLGPDEPFVVVCTYARWATKQWPAERFAEVLLRLHAETGARGVLAGSAAATDVGRRIATAAAGARPIDLSDRTTLKEMAALAAEARAMVTNDSGPMHVAAAVGTPVVAVFGPTHPGRTGPYGPGHHVLVGKAPCRPCFRRECLYSSGPRALACLLTVTAEEVARHLMEVWRAKA